jgi:hypothetical protein
MWRGVLDEIDQLRSDNRDLVQHLLTEPIMRDPDKLDAMPRIAKIGPHTALGEGHRIARPYCPCCGGANGIRAAKRGKVNAKARRGKARHKDHG